MAKKNVDIGVVKRNWDKLSRLPLGKWLFNRMLGFLVPYSGTISPEVVDIRPGFAQVDMADRRIVRNHLNSVHAIALLNLAELAGNLAMIAGLPENSRMIVTGISIEYHKKARGRLSAIGESKILGTNLKQNVEPTVRILNSAGDVVATAKLQTLVSPISTT